MNNITRFIENLLTEEDITPRQDKTFEEEAPKGYFQNPFKQLSLIGWLIILLIAICSYFLCGAVYSSICMACTVLTLTMTPRLYKVVGIPIIIIAFVLMLSGTPYEFYLPRLGFASLALAFLIFMAYKPNRKAEKTVSLAVMLIIIVGSFLVNEVYAVFLVGFASVAMFLFNINRRQVIHGWVALSVISMITISSVIFFGRSAEERAAGQQTESVLMQDKVQHRLDRWKDALIGNAPDSKNVSQTISHTSLERQVVDAVKDNVGTTTSILLVSLLFACLFPLILSVQSWPNRNKVLPLLCLLALYTDILYYLIADKAYAPAGSFIPHYIMIGIILPFILKKKHEPNSENQ